MEFAMGWNRFNLTLLGVWPEPTKTSRLKRCVSSCVFWSSTVVTVLFICLPQTVLLIVKSTTLDEIVENLSIYVPIAFTVIKQVVLRYHGRVLKLLVGQILYEWTQPMSEMDRQTMLKNARLSRQISIVCSTLTYMMLTAFIALQVWSNMQNTSEADLGGLLHPAIFPYDTRKSPNYQITWIGQLLGTVLTAICYSTFDTFLAVLVLHLCGQLTVLRTHLRNLVDATRSNNFSKYEKRLGFIVHRHEELSRFAIMIENCFTFTLLGQTMISTAMFCLTGYRMITSVDQDDAELPLVGLVFFVIHVIYTMLHLFIYCYVGEQLLTESTSMAQSAYDSEWYDLSPRKAISLIIIMMRSNVPFKITAGKFSSFSLEFFGTILKASASYLSVLLAMNGKE